MMALATLLPWWVSIIVAVVTAPVMVPLVRTVDRHLARRDAATMETTVVEEREETKRQRLGAKERERTDGVIERQLNRCEEARERERQENGRLTQTNAALTEENVQLRVERVEFDELRAKLDECHEGHARTTQAMGEQALEFARSHNATIEWVRDNFIPRGPVSEAPRPRSITPGDMPAITKE